MHLLTATPGAVENGSEAIDLGQTPGDIIILTAADTETACFASAQKQILQRTPNVPTVRLASLLHLGHNYSVDLYVEDVIAHSKLVVGRILGGRGYWPYGVEQVTALCRAKNIPLAWLPGDDQPDADLSSFSTLPTKAVHRLWQYCVQGGIDNAVNFLRYASSLIGHEAEWQEPVPLLRAGVYWPGLSQPTLEDLPWQDGKPVAALVFYRALMQAGNTRAIDTLIEALQTQGINPFPIYAVSLKDPVAAAVIEDWLRRAETEIVLNATGFSLGNIARHPGNATGVVQAPSAHTPRQIAGGPEPPLCSAREDGFANPFLSLDCPILQVVFSGGNAEGWEKGTHGLSARDIAMNVALPEVDGRVLSRAVSFKGLSRRDKAVQADIVEYQPVPDRCAFVAELAANWLRLHRTEAANRRVAIVLANYPNRDARLGNGVGLDTPASILTILNALKQADYQVEQPFEDGDALIRHLAAGPTNAATDGREVREVLSLADYQMFFATLPESVQQAVTKQWGKPTEDPFFTLTPPLRDVPSPSGRGGPNEVKEPSGGKALSKGHFALPLFTLGNVTIGLQPARGYNIDPVKTYHCPDLVPPHGYLAFYAWIRKRFRAHAVIHAGKHGNLEWLPGKAVALSGICFPEAVFGPMPHLYPFIVNDPGEGTQAKRRTQAVIIDHLTPPLTRAESYGPLRDLEQLVDEYFDAAGMDSRRLKVLKRDILDLARHTGLDQDCGMDRAENEEDALTRLDNYLCELKEMQIRDGLHIFGQSPEGELRDNLILALARTPRHDGHGGHASLTRALAADLGLGTDFDPLNCDMAAPWTGPKPKELADICTDPWRTAGDTVERLELYGLRLVRDTHQKTLTRFPSSQSGNRPLPEGEVAQRGLKRHWAGEREGLEAVLETIRTDLLPHVEACGQAELDGLLAGLDGRFVPPGSSGAPTRGRPDVLPTGRNFYSVDTRAVPTPAAWKLGWESAQMLVERHAQEQGDWPRRLALSAWGTANMRTGGDDVAQALALMGVRPTWDAASRRVTGFEVLPLEVLGRPRVDVTLRISGFFRDAFPSLIDLVDSAARTVAQLEEPEKDNPLAAAFQEETTALVTEGVAEAEAAQQAGARVFGSKPGAYGAGLQALIDEKGWTTEEDLAWAYLVWGGYAYGGGASGQPAHGLFERRLGRVEAVLHNQDNREHDLLDSDDYYQFEGGLAASVKMLSGQKPILYHNDHSRPENPKIRTLDEEIARVVRARVINPKWLRGVMRHGYKGAFEMAATVDYLFAYAATTGCVADHHFDAVYMAYLEDEEVRAFLEQHNPEALRDIATRLQEALDRHLWHTGHNTAKSRLGHFMGSTGKDS